MDTPKRITDAGNFDVEVQRVAGGGFGVVYMGPDRLHNGAWLALKTRRDGRDQRSIDAFVREALVWRGLWPHPNLVPALQVLHIHACPYIILPYAEGGNLRAHLAHGHGLARRLEWAQMIASGLLALHTPEPELFRPWPIVHRDLKPENILLDDKRTAKITDFGLARAFEVDSTALEAVGAASDGQVADAGQSPVEDGLRSRRLQTEHGVVCGTPAYMAPEQWGGAGTVGTPTDLYAFGVILSELLYGQHPLLVPGMPHRHRDWQTLHAQQAPALPDTGTSDLPPSMKALCLACLEKRQQDRPTAAEAVATLHAVAETRGEAPYVAVEVLDRTPEQIGWTLHYWASTYKRFTLREEALVRNTRALELLPEQPIVLILQGELVGKMGRTEEGLVLIERALAMELPERERAVGLGARAVLLGFAKRYDEADAAWHTFLSLRPNDLGGWHARAVLHARQAHQAWLAERSDVARAHLVRAEQYARRAVEIDPDNENNLGFYWATSKEVQGWGTTEPWTHLRVVPGNEGEILRYEGARFKKRPAPGGDTSTPRFVARRGAASWHDLSDTSPGA